MPSDRKSFWPALIIVAVAFGLPLTISLVELHIARNAHAETDAIRYLESVASAESEYRKPNKGYTASLAELPNLPKPEPYYRYQYRKTATDGYEVTAEPVEPGKHGRRYFYMDQSGVITYEVLHPATARSPETPPLAK
jgi:hypothetical protein